MNVKPTIEIIENIADKLRDRATELDSMARRMEEKNDLTNVAEVIQAIQNLFHNIRIDLLITRPIREYERMLSANKTDAGK